MATTNRLVSSPLVNRLVTNPVVFRLLFTSFVTKRFASQTCLLGGDDWLFFNYGYEEDPPMALPLAASDEPHRFFIQLYHRTAAQVDLSGKRVLEVSCGHGGGASYLTRTLHPASYTGLDLNPAGIEFCRKRHNLPGLDFVHGDAENLPFADHSVDAVVNVEASHLYRRARPPEPDATRPRVRTAMQSAHAQAICQTWPAPIISRRAFADQRKRLRRAKSSIRSAALAALAAGPVIRMTWCRARIRRPSRAARSGLTPNVAQDWARILWTTWAE
jgi:SAM-dependent methyltransferase